MEGANDSTTPILLEGIDGMLISNPSMNIRDSTHTQTPTVSTDVTQNSLTLAMLHELLESKKKQEKEIEELKKLINPKGKEDDAKNGLVNANFDDFFGDDAPSTIHGISMNKNPIIPPNFLESSKKNEEKIDKEYSKNKNLFTHSPILHDLFDSGGESNKKREEEDETIHVDFTHGMGNSCQQNTNDS